jgi:hypothetical protein
MAALAAAILFCSSLVVAVTHTGAARISTLTPLIYLFPLPRGRAMRISLAAS